MKPWFLLLSLLFAFVAASGSERQTLDEIFLKLRAVPEVFLYDPHGNANEGIQELMLRRFAGTEQICRELEKSDLPPGYAEALFDVLAFVKDPASIPWLEKQWKANPERVRESWLSRRWLGGPKTWLTGATQWAEFFLRLVAEQTDDGCRLEILKVLAWFDDDKVVACFSSLDQDPSTTGEALLCAQLYLKAHRKTFNQVRTASAVEELARSPNSRRTLLEYGSELRHEASFYRLSI